MTKYGIYYIEEHDSIGKTKPHLHQGFFKTFEEAREVLNRVYNGGKKQRYDNDFYGRHYWYWDEIFATDTEHPLTFYDMDDYVKDLINTQKWDTRTREQRSVIASMANPHTKFRLAIYGKLKYNEETKVYEIQ